VTRRSSTGSPSEIPHAGRRLIIAEVVTGISAETLSRASRLELLDSALHVPQAGFGDDDFYPEFADKAAVLVVRIARNHPLPDGNKRLAWQSLTMFCALNGCDLVVPTDEAVHTMLKIAAGELDSAESLVHPHATGAGTGVVPHQYFVAAAHNLERQRRSDRDKPSGGWNCQRGR
jgi:death on curing protein